MLRPVCLSATYPPCASPVFLLLSPAFRISPFGELRFICGNTFRSYSCRGCCCCALAFPGVSVAKVFFRWFWVFWLSFSCDFRVADNFGTRLTAQRGEEGNFKQIGAVRAPFFVCWFDFCFQFYALITLMNTFVLGQRQADMTGLMFC